MKLRGWVPVDTLIRTFNVWHHNEGSVARVCLSWYLYSDLIRYRSSVPFARKAVADALLLWSTGGFGEMKPVDFRENVLLPANAVEKEAEHEAMRERRRERKRQRAAARAQAAQS